MMRGTIAALSLGMSAAIVASAGCTGPADPPPASPQDRGDVRLYTDDGEPIVGKLRLRDHTIVLTESAFSGEPDEGELDLREMRAVRVWAEAHPGQVTAHGWDPGAAASF